MSVTAKSFAWYAVVAIASGALAITAYRYGHPIVATLIVVIPASLVINAFVADAEDEAPGGFNNPKDIAPPNCDSKVDRDA